MARHTIYAFRLVLAVVWLVWGVRDGLVLQSLGDFTNGKLLASVSGASVSIFSIIAGWIMILMAFWLLVGWAYRACAVFQIAWMIFLWWVSFLSGAILLGAIFEQVPMIALILMIWFYGPSTCVWTKARHRSTWTRG